MNVKISVLILGALVVVAAFVAWRYAGGGGNYDDFAKCLTEKGAIMYGSKYCVHCNNQKKEFGKSFQYINYVECTEQTSVCEQEGITAVPVWSVNGTKYTGEQSFERLSQLSGCPLSQQT
ncbi:hypothetical protein A3K63_00195 [Candidatus Micrarchaeota archaeon RBG_16_49_10]|nr:MAG: hypothetical protein A3K63_00195 [Candidatus Micrarchaeota archaeon RBG_16_49_10]